MSNRIPLTEMATYYTPELTLLLTDLGKIAQTMNIVEMVTPVNAGEEKQRWLGLAAHGKWTNPDFRYNRELLGSIAKLRDSVAEIEDHRMDKALATLSDEEPGKILRELAWSRCSETYVTTAVAKMILEGEKSGRKGHDGEVVRYTEDFDRIRSARFCKGPGQRQGQSPRG